MNVTVGTYPLREGQDMHAVCTIVNNMGRQVTLALKAGMRLQGATEYPLRN
jgi:hypothetical protein